MPKGKTKNNQKEEIIETIEHLGYIDTTVLEAQLPHINAGYLRQIVAVLKRNGLVEAKPKRYVKTDAWQRYKALEAVGINEEP